MSAIDAIGAVAGPPAPLARITADDSSATGSGDRFGELIGKAINNTEQVQNRADELAVQAASGDLADAQEYLAAATEASLTTQLTVAVRNKAVDAFNEIMRLQA
ncbi:MAG TPA: flagellar hook-basal body complex protein FliE [Actinophytocola sp.]|uniref:flagellar hook-basal body complex protein FliE n=1 Tax=Actinophytocola sp. TaxID=1872138 RepID=UPI002DBAF7CA|nr:flagellar hook-basal body complex protein FliE [Actinophytocola sp.]HEU5474209.1 flagellar hook-basal body complex protein FliE [Actinophytocola sp.]